MAMKLVKKGQLLDRRAEVISGARTVAEVLPPAPPGPLKFLPEENFEQSVNRLLGEARDRYRLVGEVLLEWKASTPHGQFMRLITERITLGTLKLANYQAANRFMAIAQALREGRLSEDVLPKEDGAAYLLATMRPDEIDAARREGLVRPDVSKTELTALRKHLRTPAPTPNDNRRADLERRIARLKQQLAEAEEELAALAKGS